MKSSDSQLFPTRFDSQKQQIDPQITEWVFLSLYILVFLINVFVIFYRRIYQNLSSFYIMVALTLLSLVRVSIIAPECLYDIDYREKNKVFGRLSHDLPFFLLDCVNIALLLQWIQTY